MGLIPIRALSVILVLVVLNTGCARLVPLFPHEPDMLPEPGTLFWADGRVFDLSDFAEAAAQHDFILIGESHTNACDHQFQADALDALGESGVSAALGLEMVPWSTQPILDAFHRNDVSLDNLEHRLDWEVNWGFTFSLYRPILERANHWNIPVFGLNVPRELLERIRLEGLESIPAEERGLLPPAVIPPPPRQRDLLEEEFLRHVERMPDRTAEAGFELERFVMVQSLWDTQMAHVAIQRRAPEQAMVILAGAGHVEFMNGIAFRLHQLGNDPRILSVLPWRGGPAPDPAAADLFFYCPESPQRLGLLITWQDNLVHVAGVIPGSLAEAAGLQPGDILVAADSIPLTSLETLHQAGMRAKGEQRPLQLDVLRDGSPVTLSISSP